MLIVLKSKGRPQVFPVFLIYQGSMLGFSCLVLSQPNGGLTMLSRGFRHGRRFMNARGLRLPSPCFPGILLSSKPPETPRKRLVLERTMVEKKGWNQPLQRGGLGWNFSPQAKRRGTGFVTVADLPDSEEEEPSASASSPKRQVGGFRTARRVCQLSRGELRVFWV